MTKRTQIKRFLRMAARMDIIPRRGYDQDVLCDSACCLAGHTLLEMGNKEERRQFVDAQMGKAAFSPIDISGCAERLLGLWTNGVKPHEIFDGLFGMTHAWPQEFKTPGGNVTPYLVAKRLRSIAASIQEGL